MAYSRMTGRSIFNNANREYQKVFFKNRDVKQILQYDTAVFGQAQGSSQIEVQSGIWDSTSRLPTLANEFYGDPQYWWVIALYNNRPTDGHFAVGDIYYVPLPLATVLSLYGM